MKGRSYRTEPGAFIKDPQEALERVLTMVKEGKVVTNTGNSIDIVADSICVHGDNPEAIAFTKYIREGLAKRVTVANFQDRKISIVYSINSMWRFL